MSLVNVLAINLTLGIPFKIIYKDLILFYACWGVVNSERLSK